MSTDTPAPKPADVQTGGQVMAIVPQSFAEIQRIAVQVINAGVAPASLVKYAKADDTEADIMALGKRNVAAVSTCIMAGAELGLPPMVSLRAFTVINGKPALYADGNVAVVRKARTPEGEHIAEYIKTGYIEVRDFICPKCGDEYPTFKQAAGHLVITHPEIVAELKANDLTIDAELFPRTEPTDKSHAWCEGKRSDNGEIFIEQFSIEDAKRAGLWDANPLKRAKVWRNNVQGWHDDVPNDAVWFRYPRRMMMWRAVGYCLRWLFADVLGGMADEYEAREIEGMVDVTPAIQPQRKPMALPEVPPDDDSPSDPASPKTSKSPDQPVGGGEQGAASADTLHNSDHPEGGKSEVAPNSNSQADQSVSDQSGTTDAEDNQNAPVIHPATGEVMIDNRTAASLETYFARLNDELSPINGEDEFELAWIEYKVEEQLAGNDEALDRAAEVRKHHLARIRGEARKALEDAGQTSMFADGLPEVPE